LANNFKNKEKLINAALDEFMEKSFDKASLNNILKNANLSKGTFYYHFNDKKDLYLYLVELVAEEKKNYMQQVSTNENIDPSNIFDLFNMQVRYALDFAKSNLKYYKFGQLMLKEENEEIKKGLKEKISAQSKDYIGPLIDNAYEKGYIREDVPKEFSTKIFSYMFSNFYEIFEDEIDLDNFDKAAEELDYLLEILKNGLAK
jgi:AcrR family transcriptional regulator